VLFYFISFISLVELSLIDLCRFLSIAEETLAEFLSKATGTAVDWVQMPGMKVENHASSGQLVFAFTILIL